MYEVGKHGRWLYVIRNTDTKMLVRKPQYEGEKFAYTKYGEATFLTFRSQQAAEKYIQENLQK